MVVTTVRPAVKLLAASQVRKGGQPSGQRPRVVGPLPIEAIIVVRIWAVVRAHTDSGHEIVELITGGGGAGQ